MALLLIAITSHLHCALHRVRTLLLGPGSTVAALAAPCTIEPGGTEAPYPGHTTEEIARRGQELYEQEIRQRVDPEHEGRFLVVDVVSRDYEVADEDLTASDRLLDRRPDAMLSGLRVGRDYTYRLGGRFPDSSDEAGTS